MSNNKITFSKICKSKTKLYANLYGLPGSGKTYSALVIATTLATSNEKVLAIDTENRLNIYAQDFPDIFVYNMSAPMSVLDLMNVVVEAKKNGFEAVVIDSLTPFWEKLIVESDQIAKSNIPGSEKKVGTQHGANWKIAKQLISSLSIGLSNCGMHVITTSLAQDVVNKFMEPTGDIKPCFERKKFEPYLDLQLMLSNNGEIEKIDKSWHHDFKDIIKVKNAINKNNIIKIKEWLGNGVSIDNKNIIDYELNKIKTETKELEIVNILDDIFEKTKNLSENDKRAYYKNKNDNIKTIWKNGLDYLKLKYESYEKDIKELENLTKTIDHSVFETEEVKEVVKEEVIINQEDNSTINDNLL
jgi:hypothetical protein